MSRAFVVPAMVCAAVIGAVQAEDSIVLYGRVFVTIESVEAKGGATPLPKRTRIEDNPSMFGVRTTEDLGEGLKGFFQLESHFKTDSSGSGFADRNSGVGAQASWGTVLLGRWDMPLRAASVVVDPYGDLTLSGITGTLSDLGNFRRRAANVVQYWSPNIGGVVFRAAATANEGRTAAIDPRSYGASLTFTRGALYAFGGWELHENESTTLRREQGAALGGSYAFGPIKIGGQYQRIEKAARADVQNWMANVVFSAGQSQFIAQFMQSKGGGLSDTPQPACDSWSVGYQYFFTGRTFFIASYVRVGNNAAATCDFGGPNTLAIAAGQDPRGLFAGLSHLF